MSWVKLDDRFPRHPKVAPLSDIAFRLYVTAKCWSNEWMTDGFVPQSELRNLAKMRRPRAVVEELIGAKLWHWAVDVCEHCLELRAAKKVAEPLPVDGFVIHDFHDYQRPGWAVKADKAADRKRMQDYRASLAAEQNGAHPPGGVRPRSGART